MEHESYANAIASASENLGVSIGWHQLELKKRFRATVSNFEKEFTDVKVLGFQNFAIVARGSKSYLGYEKILDAILCDGKLNSTQKELTLRAEIELGTSISKNIWNKALSKPMKKFLGEFMSAAEREFLAKSRTLAEFKKNVVVGQQLAEDGLSFEPKVFLTSNSIAINNVSFEFKKTRTVKPGKTHEYCQLRVTREKLLGALQDQRT